MASSTPRVILLEVNGAERPVFDDRIAGAAGILPGDLIELDTAGDVVVLAGATKTHGRMFAVEQGFIDAVNAKNIDHAYDDNQNVPYIYAQGGDLIYARVAASQTVVIGSLLGPSATGGCLAVVSAPGDATVIAVAEAAVTTTGSTGRVKARIL